MSASERLYFGRFGSLLVRKRFAGRPRNFALLGFSRDSIVAKKSLVFQHVGVLFMAVLTVQYIYDNFWA